MNKGFGIFGGMIFMLISVECRADCTEKLDGFPRTNIGGPSTLLVRKNTSVGTVLFSVRGYLNNNTGYIECTGNVTNQFYTSFDNTAYINHPIKNGVIDTDVPGIGVRTTTSWTVTTTPANLNINLGGQDIILEGDGPRVTTNFTTSWRYQVSSMSVLYEIIKTGDVTQGGVINKTTIGLIRLYVHANGTNYYFQEAQTASTIIVTPGCEVVGNADKVISFGTVVNKNLSTLSNTAIPGSERELSVELKCNAGTKVAVTYDSSDKDLNYRNAVTNRGTAKGVVVYFDNIGELGQQNMVINSANESEVIKQTVSLYRTTDAFSAGTISAQANYTLNYE
ncbi:fimbrial protein [Vagococcus sp. WN89Y]|uniref:fimbrial protein n=1 Tax=Vagococcus sp. WN89Y TaxID=3457258 RepID=UPI003FCDE6C1